MRTLQSSGIRRSVRGSKTFSTRPGTTAVELALVAPAFFLIVLGIIEVGRGFMTAHLLTNAARVGCRVGVIEGRTNTDVKSAVNNLLASQRITGDSVTIDVNGPAGDVAKAQPGDQITVVVSISASQVTWLPLPRFLTGTISGQYALRRE